MAVKRIYTDLDVSGLGTFTGVVSGAQGVAAGDFVNKGQMEALSYLQSVNDDIAPVLAGSLDAGGFSIINLNAITATGNLTTTGNVVATNISGINTGDQDLSVLLPLTAGNTKALTGAIFGGADLVVTDKAKHTTLWKTTLREQYSHWNGSGWVAMSGMGIGEDALLNNTGYQSNAIGFNALNANTGDYANGIGYNTLINNTGIYSNGIGHSALATNTGGESNGFGYYALYANTGFRSSGLGHQALHSNSGAGSTGIGSNTLYFNNGDYNTAIGSEAFADDHIAENITNATVIGANAEPTASNQVMLGDANITQVTVGNPAYAPAGVNDLVNKGYVDNLSVDFGGYQEIQPVTYIDSVNGGGTYIDKGTEEIFLTSVNDVALGGFHGIVYVEKHKSLYASSRSITTKVFRFPDVTDLTTYTEIDISVASYGGTENIVYDEVKDKLYCVMSDSTYSQYFIKVWEIDPITMVKTLVIDYDTTNILIALPTFSAFGGFLYVANGYYTNTLFRFDLSDYTLDTSAVVGNAGNIMHNIMSDGTKLYITSGTIWDANGIQVTRIHATTLFVEETIQIPLVGDGSGFGGFTDDGIVIGDYFYVGTEAQPVNTLYRFNKNDLTDNVSLQVKTQGGDDDFWAIAYEGDRIWYTGKNGTFGSLDINTLENGLYTNPFTNNMNELVLNGRQMLVAGFDDYPVTGTAFIGRTGSPFQIEGLIRLDNTTGAPTLEGAGDAILAAASQTFTGNNTFTQPLAIGEPLVDGDAATKLYVDAAVSGVIAADTWLIQKATGNTDLNTLEIGDFVRGQRSLTKFWESAQYLGGDEAEDTNWKVYNSFNI